MEVRTYTERSNARRAARGAGLDPDAAVIQVEDGFEVRFEPREQHEPRSLVEMARSVSAPVCTYPSCKCVVSTSTSQPEPVCPKGLEREPSPIKQAVEAAIERGIGPKEFVQIAEGVADALDPIPEFCKIPTEKRRESWIKNPPKQAAANLREAITMAKTKAKEKKARGEKGSDKTATLLKMLAGKGSTVEQMTKALEWLPHTLRARISRLPKEDKKIKIERERGGRRYQLSDRVVRLQQCHCGSGEFPDAVHDGHGIFMCYVCSKCRREKLSGWREDIFERYETDEAVESD